MKTKEQTYIEAITEIEAIIKKIEDSDLNVDELNIDIKRAAELINFCKSKLYATEESINKIFENLN